jgi:hypothetical protein
MPVSSKDRFIPVARPLRLRAYHIRWVVGCTERMKLFRRLKRMGRFAADPTAAPLAKA